MTYNFTSSKSKSGTNQCNKIVGLSIRLHLFYQNVTSLQRQRYRANFVMMNEQKRSLSRAMSVTVSSTLLLMYHCRIIFIIDSYLSCERCSLSCFNEALQYCRIKNIPFLMLFKISIC